MRRAVLLLLAPALAGCTAELPHEEPEPASPPPGGDSSPDTPDPGRVPARPPSQGPDHDGDGLSTDEELALGTNGFEADTDHDGLSDGDEVALGTRPLTRDSDLDGVCDGAEVQAKLDPGDPDTDGDGFLDGQEGKWLERAQGFTPSPECPAPGLDAWRMDLDPLGLDLVFKPYVMEGVQAPAGWEGFLRERLARLPLQVSVAVLPASPLASQPAGMPPLPGGSDHPIHQLVFVRELDGNATTHTYGWADTPGMLAVVAAGRIAQDEPARFEELFRQVLMHEVGHNLGLLHVDPAAQPPPRTAMREQADAHTTDDLTPEEWARAAQLFTTYRNRELRKA